MNHVAGAFRRPSGHYRWYAACTCGWRDNKVKSREEAALEAHKHQLVSEVAS